ncbi:MAG: ATP-binding cassette domain-containing protein [Ruminiclostridium sp.]|nr:ATP-binding cassette domain-containing protein [Ruminiclostridium sp.]
MNIMTVEDLKKTYKTYERGSSFIETLKSLVVRETIIIEALKGISFNVEDGELLGLIGPNGAGKSTTMKILTGVLYPTSGEVNIMGFTPWRQRKNYVSEIGAVFGQKSQLIWDIPPVDSFEMNRAIYAIPRQEFKKRLGLMVEILNVESVVRKPTRQLSLGERMKCEFIMAMLHAPKIVFLDEPTIGLDVVAKDRIRDFIHEMNRNGTTFILTTHDLGDIERLAKRVLVINHGELIFDDGIETLRSVSGSKKVINITTRNELADFDGVPGISITSRASLFSAELMLDTSITDLNRFTHLVNESNVISDMTIKDPPIENVVKEMYSRDLHGN